MSTFCYFINISYLLELLKDTNLILLPIKIKKEFGEVILESYNRTEIKYCRAFIKECLELESLYYSIPPGIRDEGVNPKVYNSKAKDFVEKLKPEIVNGIFFKIGDKTAIKKIDYRGKGDLLKEKEHSKIKIVASEKEHELITTNPDELLKNNPIDDDEEELEEIKIRERPEKLKEVRVKVDETKGFYKKSNLTINDIEYLKEYGYQEFIGRSITSNKKEKYFIMPRFNESPQHCFLIYDLASYLKKFTNNIQLYQTKKPDIIFKINNKEYAIEVETGKSLKHKKNQLKEKVEELNTNYGNRWFFVMTNRKLTPEYSEFGPTYHKLSIKNKIMSLVNNKKGA